MEISILFYLSLILAILIHEVGHLITVLCVGHKLTEFSVGPISIKWSETGYFFSPRKSLFTGLVAYRRVHEKTTWKNEILIVSGGVIANIILGVSFIVYYHFISNNGFIVIIGWVSLLVAVVNLFPTHVKALGLDSDARQFFDIFALKKAIFQFKSYDLAEPVVHVKLQSFNDIDSDKTQIELLNDDVTPMRFVVDLIRTFFNLNDFSSMLIMLSIHNDGNAKLGWLGTDEARLISEQINSEAHLRGFPFQCRISTE